MWQNVMMMMMIMMMMRCDDGDHGGAFQDDCTALYECEEEKTIIKMMIELFSLKIGMFVKKTIMTSFQD